MLTSAWSVGQIPLPEVGRARCPGRDDRIRSHGHAKIKALKASLTLAAVSSAAQQIGKEFRLRWLVIRAITPAYGATRERMRRVQATRDSPGGKVLIVSNEPESIAALPLLDEDGADTNTLYKCSIEVSTSPKTFRVFVWHTNDMNDNSDVWIHLALSVASGTATASSFVVEDDASSNLLAMGVCLAKVQLYQTFDPSPGGKNLSPTEISAWKLKATKGQTVGAVIQFSVTASEATDLRIRTIATPSSSLSGSWGDKPAGLGSPQQVRGWWPWSQIELPCGTFDSNPGSAVANLRVGVCEADGPEEVQYAQQQSDTYGSVDGNEGLYGVNLFYNFTLVNSGTQTSPVYVQAQCRNTAGYWGAAYIAAPSGYVTRGLAKIKPGTSEKQWALLSSGSDNSQSPIYVQPIETVDLTIAVANGGAAALPFNLVLTKVAFEEPE